MKKNYKLILFDKDGVLINSMHTSFQAFNNMLKHYGLEKWDEKRLRKDFWGGHDESTLKKAYPNILEVKRKEMVEYYHKRRLELEHLTKIYPSTIPVLEALKGKYKLGLITSSYKHLAEKILKLFNLLKYFDVVVGGDEVKPKPAPDPILKACEILKINPKETVYVGDNVQDIGSGKAAGCMTIAITTTKSRKELESIGSDFLIIDDLKEILEILKT